MNHQLSINRVLQRAKEVFGDPEKARGWMDTPNLALGDKPVSLLVFEDGERAVLRVLNLEELFKPLEWAVSAQYRAI